MRTTLNLPDALMERLRAHARQSGRTVTSVVEEALLDALDAPRRPQRLPDLPSSGTPGGAPLVDIGNRETLYAALDGP